MLDDVTWRLEVLSRFRRFRNRFQGWLFHWYREESRDGYLLDCICSKPFSFKAKLGFVLSAFSVLSFFVETVFGISFSVFNAFFLFWIFYPILCFPGCLSVFMLCVYFLFFYLYCSFIGVVVRIAFSLSFL
jgi:hypothetical protein